MKRILSKISAWRAPFKIIGLAVFSVALVTTLSASAANYTQITSQLDPGSRGENVTNLQMFLAANPNIYPEGIVTGYYGPLTETAVKQFQSQYGIDLVGRVGPLTMQKINNLIANGGWYGTADISGPKFYAVNQSTGSNSATFSWTTDENATAKIFYYTDWIKMNEGDINSVGFGSINGWTAVNDGVARTSQQVTISGLQSNTTYHYVIISTDSSGNVSVWNPNTTFRTN
jgi:peptidoglycan hydrolase-like protein with peptidoglycan-binding domain